MDQITGSHFVWPLDCADAYKGIATPTHIKHSDELYSLRSYTKHAMFSTIIKAYFSVKINTLQIQVNIFVVCKH